MKYAIIVDAGSSGSRLFVYSWQDPAKFRAALGDSPATKALLPIETQSDWVARAEPGISSYEDNLGGIWRDHLSGLVDKANQIVPKESRHETPFFFLATAGLRMVEESKRTAILEQVCAQIRRQTTFYLPECETHVTMIDGQTEGLYGWLGLNYLVNYYKNQEWMDYSRTYGFLDMGGGSTQIAFAPNKTESQKHANDLSEITIRNVAGEAISWQVFVSTWLRYGTKQAQIRHREKLMDKLPKEELTPADEDMPIIVQDPCLQHNAVDYQYQTVPGVGENVRVAYFGTSKFEECHENLEKLLNLGEPCTDEPCLFDGVHVPGFDWTQDKFIGISEYWYTAEDLYRLNGKMDYATFLQRSREFCTTNWEDVKVNLNEGLYGSLDEDGLRKACFKTSWVLEILHKGFQIPLEPADPEAKHNFLDTFQSAQDIDGKELTWTYGRAVLYAASSIEPVESGVPVGHRAFGQSFVTGGELLDSALPGRSRSHTSEAPWLVLGVFLFVILLVYRRNWLKLFPRWLVSRLLGAEPGLPTLEDHDAIPLQSYPLATGSIPPSRVSSRVNMREWET